MQSTIWLRAEQKTGEHRSPLTPDDAAKLIANGNHVVVESSNQRVFNDEEYTDAGCSLTNEGSWHSSDQDTFILGIKELPDNDHKLRHRHIYFGHAYKQQAGWQELISRFKQHNGTLLDLEFLTNNNGRRLAAFGFWAGYAGAAIALKIWIGRQIHGSTFKLEPQIPYTNKQVLIEELEKGLTTLPVSNKLPKIVVVGALGRCGQGATELLNELNLDTDKWDIKETQKGGPFKELLDFDILINTVLLGTPIPPFLTNELIHSSSRSLSVISDVSCDPQSAGNPLPIYAHATKFTSPSIRLITDNHPLDLTAIDHLPSLLPRESSTEFSHQLLPCLLRLDNWSEEWQRCAEIYSVHANKINLQ